MPESLSPERLAEVRIAYDRSLYEPMQMGVDGLIAWNAVPDLAAEIERLHRENTRLTGELQQAKAQLLAVAMCRAWTNEDGKSFVFAEDLRAALDGPATKAVSE